MHSMKWMVSAAVLSLSVVGCGGQAEEGSLATGRVAAPLTDGNKLFGSDTLKGALISANTSAVAGLAIEGKGSGAGEGCVRSGSGTFCSGRQQTIAPMSRDFRSTTNACANGGPSGGTDANGNPRNAACCPGEQSNAIALDAVNLWVNVNNDLTNGGVPSITMAQAKALYCGTDGSGSAAACGITTWGQLGTTSNPNGVIAKYRRDDLSGTTDTFKSLLGCTNFCADVVTIADGALPAACAGQGSATECIGELVSTDINAVGYSGDSARKVDGSGNARNKALLIAGIAPTAANVRKLITDPANAYPLSRFLFLNENTGFTKDPKEQALYDWVYANKASFQSILVGQGFIACSGTGALRCGGAANDGRGAGLCKGN
ncbi:substrate-binding domain-containing protein [Myxococcus sp. K15C18031901]|uniref:PstS family phosphate ABC transporter substrate-binding protein n=1 Tax=Myxococcus dinghuensis TaxID=2906761 RepID=UPI0020A7B242|nr:substrate-binding domain-containing protein [Myxococcus dinghuensis]MCP3100955.1 substrate-binding domain-containing protein [Myxococcus dinghuensis]